MCIECCKGMRWLRLTRAMLRWSQAAAEGANGNIVSDLGDLLTLDDEPPAATISQPAAAAAPDYLADLLGGGAPASAPAAAAPSLSPASSTPAPAADLLDLLGGPAPAAAPPAQVNSSWRPYSRFSILLAIPQEVCLSLTAPRSCLRRKTTYRSRELCRLKLGIKHRSTDKGPVHCGSL